MVKKQRGGYSRGQQPSGRHCDLHFKSELEICNQKVREPEKGQFSFSVRFGDGLGTYTLKQIEPTLSKPVHNS